MKYESFIFVSMISNNKNLIYIFTTLFLFLLGIQVYFMYKTYQVKEREIYRSIDQGISVYTDQVVNNHSAKDSKNDSLQQVIIKYYHKKLNEQDFIKYLVDEKKNSGKNLTAYINEHRKKDGYIICVRIQYRLLIHLPDSIKLLQQPVTIYETKDKVRKPAITSIGTWRTSSTQETTGKKPINNMDSFHVETQTEIEIGNIKSLVFREIILLIICCVILLASVLILYIFTIKNLIQQQKQVKVLHTVVDNISHEFKTPIATLKIASKTLKKGWNPDTLPLIDRQITRLESLMLQLHKDETPEEIIAIQPENWDFFIQDLAFTYPQIDFKSENKVSRQLPFDKNLMETIVKNLCENSIKYGASIVTVNTSNTAQNLKIEVSDNGNGMESKELKNIFEKFYRIQANNIHNSKGLGLGLYFVKEIVTSYHGKIEVSSQPGMGSTFKITIPYEN